MLEHRRRAPNRLRRQTAADRNLNLDASFNLRDEGYRLTIENFVQAFKAMWTLIDAQRETFSDRMRDWELCKREWAQRGSIGDKALNTPKREIPALETEGHDILAAAQMTLRLNTSS